MNESDSAKHGARVVIHVDGVIQVSQTVKSGGAHNAPYVTDVPEKFIRADEGDAAVGKAVRDACAGRLNHVTEPPTT